MSYAPIALFTYNRALHTRTTIEKLLVNIESSESDLIIFSDGTKNQQDEPGVTAVRDYLKTVSGFKSVKILEQKNNIGLAQSIISGVTQVVNEYGKIIVMEDDLVVTPYFLGFMNRALDKYETDQRVVQISGYMFPVKTKVEVDSLFLPLCTSWGWATWQSAWRLFDETASGYEKLKNDDALRKQFNLNGAYDYYSMLEDQLAGRIDSWAIRWNLSVFMIGGLTLYPRQSLVINTGFDGSGTHGIVRTSLLRSGAKDSFKPDSFPESVSVGETWTVVCDGLRIKPSWMQKIKKWLRTLL